MNTTSRRNFLKILGTTSITTLLDSSMPIPVLAQISPHSITETRILMGTFVTITASHPSMAVLENAFEHAFETIVKKEAIYSQYNTNSPISILNKQGKLLDAPEELLNIIQQSLHIERLTAGAFDITVKPIVDLLKSRKNPMKRTTIQPNELREVIALTGSSHISIHNQDIQFHKQGMSITLEGIAKGYICDCASEAMSSLGVNNHLINAGGDIISKGYKHTNQPWVVAIEDPAKGWNYPNIVNLTNCALATSGSYEDYFDIEHKYHHLVNPVSGESPKNLSVSVVAPTTLEADALATALSVMTPKAGINLIKQYPGRACIIIESSGMKHTSPSWNKIRV